MEHPSKELRGQKSPILLTRKGKLKQSLIDTNNSLLRYTYKHSGN